MKFIQTFPGGGASGTSDYPDLTNKPSINGVELSGNKTASDLGINIPDVSGMYSTGDSASTDIADDDYVPFYDSSASAKKKSLWSNIKALLKTYFDGLYQKTLTAGTNIGISGTTISATNTIALNYSTSEQVVGTWIDGASLYQKTISCGTLTNGTEKLVSTGLSNVSVKEMFGYTYKSSGTMLPLPESDGTNDSNIRLSARDDGATIVILPNYDVTQYTETYVTIRYTK